MWIIVFFDDENTVEAVPAHWIKNNLCARSKINTKKCIERRKLILIIFHPEFKKKPLLNMQII